MKNFDLKEKTRSTLPLQGKLSTSNEEVALEEMNEKKQSFSSSLEELIGERNERRECSVGVRVTREMKEILENLSAKSRLSESEIVFRILQKNLKLD